MTEVPEFSLTTVSANFTGNSILFTPLPNLPPATNLTTYQNGTSNIYIRLNTGGTYVDGVLTGGTLSTVGFVLNTYQIPYSGTLSYVFFANQSLLLSNALVAGNNVVNYNFYDASGSITIFIEVIPVPIATDTYQLVALGNSLKYDVFDDLFGTDVGYTLTSAISSDSVNLPISYLSSGRITAMVPPNATPGSYTITVAIDAVPKAQDLSICSRVMAQPNISSSLSLSMTIHITIYDPSNITQIYAWSNVGVLTSYSNLFAGGTKLLQIMYNDQILNGSKDNVLDWSGFPTLKVFSQSQIVEPVLSIHIYRGFPAQRDHHNSPTNTTSSQLALQYNFPILTGYYHELLSEHILIAYSIRHIPHQLFNLSTRIGCQRHQPNSQQFYNSHRDDNSRDNFVATRDRYSQLQRSHWSSD